MCTIYFWKKKVSNSDDRIANVFISLNIIYINKFLLVYMYAINTLVDPSWFHSNYF